MLEPNTKGRRSPIVISYIVFCFVVVALCSMVMLDGFINEQFIGKDVVVAGLPATLINSGVLLVVSAFILYLSYLVLRKEILETGYSCAMIAAIVLMVGGFGLNVIA